MIQIIEDTAIRILEVNPGPVVRYRLLRDVLRRPAQDAEILRAKEALPLSKNFQELANEQRGDGGWGPFHSRRTQLKQKILTTEVGVERALALGLDVSHPILSQASAYILEIMQGKIAFPDYQEVNDRWPTGMRLFLASTLSLIQPDHPALDVDRRLWQNIATRTFQSGEYREEDEIAVHRELTGATVKGSYLLIDGRYQLNILGSLPGLISKELEMVLLRWLWERSEGIRYLGIPLNRPPPDKPGHIDRWLASLELLARLFPAWVHFASDSIDWIWTQRSNTGYWDFGSRPDPLVRLPLSDSWRERQNRNFDWTTRILIILRQYYG